MWGSIELTAVLIFIIIITISIVFVLMRNKPLITGGKEHKAARQKSLIIYIMRHAETEANRDHRVNNDEEHITERGKEQAHAAGKYLARRLRDKNPSGFDKIYVSTLDRARETADIVAEEVGYDKKNLIPDKRLVEVYPGDFTGEAKDSSKIAEYMKLRKEFLDGDPIRYSEKFDEFEKIVKERYNVETRPEVHKRLISFLGTLPQSGTILIVTHNSYIHYMLGYMFKLGVSHPEFRLMGGKNCHICLVEKKNDTYELIYPPTTEYMESL